jgi:hypothetical protein
MSTVKISFQVSPTSPDMALGFETWIDSTLIYSSDAVTDVVNVDHNLNDDDAEHTLKFVLKGKTAEHTKMSDAGEIIKDSLLNISDVAFDEIKLGHTFTTLAVYHHDFNGTQSQIQDEFYGCMGCNGTVELKFSTPVYLWLLENM